MKNEFHYKYRLIKSSWGIAIDLIGYLSVLPSPADRIIYQLSPSIDTSYQTYMQKGIQFFHDHLYDGRKISYVVTFEKVHANPCDYQNEGLIVAVIECLSKINGIPFPQIDVRFDHLANQYEFQYGNIKII